MYLNYVRVHMKTQNKVGRSLYDYEIDLFKKLGERKQRSNIHCRHFCSSTETQPLHSFTQTNESGENVCQIRDDNQVHYRCGSVWKMLLAKSYIVVLSLISILLCFASTPSDCTGISINNDCAVIMCGV